MTVEECFQAEADDNPYHPVIDYLDSLEWDGNKRIHLWLTHVFGVEATSYAQAVAAKMLIAAVRRVRQPGAQFDYMMILEGNQGIGKSQTLRILFGEKFVTDQLSNLSSKDASIDLRGKCASRLPRPSTF